MNTKELNFKQSVQGDDFIIKIIEIVEDETHVLQRFFKDVLDEIVDILHDDLRFKNKITNRALVKPEVRKKIAAEVLRIIIGDRKLS